MVDIQQRKYVANNICLCITLKFITSFVQGVNFCNRLRCGTVSAGKRIKAHRSDAYMLLCFGKVFEESASTRVAVGRKAFSILNSLFFASHMMQQDANLW